jgi:hypothetical protein
MSVAAVAYAPPLSMKTAITVAMTVSGVMRRLRSLWMYCMSYPLVDQRTAIGQPFASVPQTPLESRLWHEAVATPNMGPPAGDTQ